MTPLENALGNWVALCERNARRVLWILALVTAAAGFIALRYSSIDSDLSKLIRPSPDLAWFQDDLAWKADFPDLQETAVVAVSGRSDAAVQATARRLRDAFRASSAFRRVLAPGVDPFLAEHGLYFLDAASFAGWRQGLALDLAPMTQLAAAPDPTTLAASLAGQARALPGVPLADPLASGLHSLDVPPGSPPALRGYPHLTPGGDALHYQLLILKGEQRLDQRLPNAALVAHIQDIVRDTPADPGVQVHLTGEVKLADEEIRAALGGIGIAGSISLVLLAIILGLGVRSVRSIGAIFLLLAVGVVLTLGWATLAVGSYNTLALIFVVMFFGLGVDFAVHFVLRIRESEPADGSPSPAVAAARDIGPALLLCMLTSAIAFLAFVPTAYRGLGELGIISAGGMAIAVTLSLTLLPALFAVTGQPTPLPPKPPALRAAPGFLRQRMPWVLAATVLAAAAAWEPASGLRFDYSVLAMRDLTTEGMRTLLALQRSGQITDYSISVLVDDRASADALTARLEALPEVAAVRRPADLIPDHQGARRAELDELARQWANVGPVRPLAAPLDPAPALTALGAAIDGVPADARPQAQAFARALADLDPDAHARVDAALAKAAQVELDDLQTLLDAQPYGIDDLPPDLRATLVGSDGRRLLRVQPARPLTSRAATDEFVHAVAAVAPNIAGRTVVEWGVGDVVVHAFREAATLALGAIGVLLMIYFRGLVLPLLVLIPIGLSVLFTAAIAELTGLTLNMANILVVPLIFGLGVDAGIHVVHRFTHDGGLEGLGASSTPRAVLISGLTTIGTFFSLSFSPHKGAASIGVLLFIAITLMLLATFVVLPALLELRARITNAIAARA